MSLIERLLLGALTGLLAMIVVLIGMTLYEWMWENFPKTTVVLTVLGLIALSRLK